jgi:3-oxoacyl-[acyl-carrier protein] reductase
MGNIVFSTERRGKLIKILKKKVVIVTGGASGIGREISIKFAKEGASIVVADLNEEEAIKVLDRIKEEHGDAIFIETDVSKEASVINMVNETIKKYNKIEILVNNAGIISISNLLHISLDEWNKIIGINLTGVFLCSRAALPFIMKQGWGRIINISSTSGITGGTSGAHYAAAKGGVIAFTKAISREFAPYGITVNSIAPSKIETDMLKSNVDEEGRKALLQKIPVGRLGKPGDIANLALFFASEESGYITGEVIVASGGYM